MEAFTQLEKLAAWRDLPWWRKLREDAFARFMEVGFPTTHDEDWRFTNVSSIAQTPFQMATKGSGSVSKDELEPWRVPGAACQLVFVNGRFAPELTVHLRLRVDKRHRVHARVPARQLVFVNGRFAPELSQVGTL